MSQAATGRYVQIVVVNRIELPVKVAVSLSLTPKGEAIAAANNMSEEEIGNLLSQELVMVQEMLGASGSE